MHYFSTNRSSPAVTFEKAVLGGQPEDKGLYFPNEVPNLPQGFWSSLHQKLYDEIAFEVIRPYVDGDIPDDILFEACHKSVDFPFPVVPLVSTIYALELFHGPTLAFKDVGARFMSRCLRFFLKKRGQKAVVLVATSGDTGGAVANGFHGVDGIEVVILFPKGRISRVQELQLTTLGGNVTALEIRGNFDDCQRLAKQALADGELRGNIFITSANSINIARWLPQQFYYFFALKQWDGERPVISVPSGNFGNIAAGLLAQRSGLPAELFIAACNANDVVPKFFETGDLRPAPAVTTLSNAMDVGDPSNFVRVLEIFDRDLDALMSKLKAVSISDDTTADTMRSVYEETGYVLEPHGAVAYRALTDHLKEHPGLKGIFLETAHPVKFECVENILGHGAVSTKVSDLFLKQKDSVEMEVDYNCLRQVLLSKV